MSQDIEGMLRSPKGYSLARQAIEMMEHHQVWPTPLNFDIWLHYLGDPQGALGQALGKLVSSGDPITDALSEELAAFLPRPRLNDEITDAGAQLSDQLQNISKALGAARDGAAAYGRTLVGASETLSQDPGDDAIKSLVSALSTATGTVRRENLALERRLNASTLEITKLRSNLDQVRREAMTDGLTTLANRKAFDERLEKACVEAAASGEPLSLVVVDIDNFKRFNDTWGHQTGDQVIRYVASVISKLSAPPRLAARYGGEEFALILPGSTVETIKEELENARIEISSRVLKRRSTNENLGSVTVSLGLTAYRDGESAIAFLERADAALYASKHAGRDRLTIADILLPPAAGVEQAA